MQNHLLFDHINPSSSKMQILIGMYSGSFILMLLGMLLLDKETIVPNCFIITGSIIALSTTIIAIINTKYNDEFDEYSILEPILHFLSMSTCTFLSNCTEDVFINTLISMFSTSITLGYVLYASYHSTNYTSQFFSEEYDMRHKPYFFYACNISIGLSLSMISPLIYYSISVNTIISEISIASKVMALLALSSISVGVKLGMFFQD
jgi:hypothetical protein